MRSLGFWEDGESRLLHPTGDHWVSLCEDPRGGFRRDVAWICHLVCLLSDVHATPSPTFAGTAHARASTQSDPLRRHVASAVRSTSTITSTSTSTSYEDTSAFSSTSATPWPEPTQTPRTPKRAFRSRNSVASVRTYRVPDAPKGWPMATAPPLGFNRSSGTSKPSSWIESSRRTPKA